MWHDLRHAVRTLRKHPGFVALAALVLALGIGLNTAIFSIVYAMLFKPLPVSNPADLVSIYVATTRQPDRPSVIPRRAAEYFARHNPTLTDVALHWGITLPMRADGETDAVNLEWVTSNYFEVLGVKPALGRPLLAAEDSPATPERAMVISDALWVRRFKSDPKIVGRQVALSPYGEPDLTFTIVGVMPRGFTGVSEPWKPTHGWVTFAQGRNAVSSMGRPRGSAFIGAAIARLRPGVTFEQARAAIQTQIPQAFERYYAPGIEPFGVVYRTNDVRIPNDPSATVVPVRLAGAMTIVVGLVLLIAATNIAGILMARAVGRAGEIAVRRVLGASPLRLVRQLLAESLLLSSFGGVLGVLLATWLLSLFEAFTPMRFAFDVGLETRVLLFTAAICLAAGVIVGLMPAIQATRIDILPRLAGGNVQMKQTRGGLRHAITLPQVTVSLVLLLVAGVYVRALLKVELTDVGYQHGNLLVMSPMFRFQPGEHHTTPDGKTDERYAERARRFYQQLFARARTIRGTNAVAIADSLPLREPPERPNWSIVSRDAYLAGERNGPGTERASVSPGYFTTMGMSLSSGRDFDERDSRTSPPVAIVSRGLAQALWPGRDPVGQSLTILNAWESSNTRKLEWFDVVGVVSDVAPILHERSVRPFVYFPLGQEWRPSASYVLARGAGDSRTLIPAVKDAIVGADPFADVRRTQTMTQMVDEILYPRRIAAAILAVSGAIALFLATIGIYGVVSYSVAQRTGEIGVRMALGADRHDIMRLVLRDGAMIATIGSIAGLVLGYTAIRITSSKYLALPQLDLAAIAVTPLVLTAVVLFACYLPARRAGRVDVMEVLRRA